MSLMAGWVVYHYIIQKSLMVEANSALLLVMLGIPRVIGCQAPPMGCSET